MASKALANALKIRNLSIENSISSILNPLKQKKTNISLSIKALSVLSENIKQNNIRSKQNIENKFNKIIEEIQFKKQELFKKISLIEKKKLSQIDKQCQSLSKCQQTVMNAITSCNTIINDKTNNLKPVERKQKVRLLIDNTLDSLEMPSKVAVKDKIKYTFNHKNTATFISSICNISDDILQPLPVITNLKCDSISHQTATIHWNAELSSNTNQNKVSCNLYMTLRVNDDDGLESFDDEKKIEDIQRNLNKILFDENKQQYSYKLEDLSPNKQYKVNINCMEMEISNNEELERTEFVPISIRFKTKKEEAPKMELFRFQTGHETMKVSDDGLSVTGYGQLRFGEYLKAENKEIYKVTFSTKNVNSEHCGIGFATKGFINTHNNHRMIVYGNKKILISKEFKNGKKLSNIFWNKGEDVIIEINMKSKQGIMYRKFKDEQGIDNLDIFYKIDLPDFVAICVRFAVNITQTLTVVHQKFV